MLRDLAFLLDMRDEWMLRGHEARQAEPDLSRLLDVLVQDAEQLIQRFREVLADG